MSTSRCDTVTVVFPDGTETIIERRVLCLSSVLDDALWIPQNGATSSGTPVKITLTEEPGDMKALFLMLEQIFPEAGAFGREPESENPLPDTERIARVAQLADKYDVTEAIRMVFCRSLLFCGDNAEWDRFLFGIATKNLYLCRASLRLFDRFNTLSDWKREEAESLGDEMYWALREASEKVEGEMTWAKVVDKMDWKKALGL